MPNSSEENDFTTTHADECLEPKELEALLSGLGHDADLDGWRPVDFRARSSRLTATERRQLAARHEAFCAGLASRLSALIGRPVQVELDELSATEASRFTRALAAHTTLHHLAAVAPSGGFLIALSPRLVLRLLGCLLGSIGNESESRALTPLERELSTPIVERTLDALAESWQLDTPEPRHATAFDLLAAHCEPLETSAAAPYTPVAVLRFRVTLERSSRAGELSIAVPFGELLSWLTRPTTEPRDGEDDRTRLVANLGQRALTLSAEIRSEPLALDEMLALEPGDVIDTGVPTGTLARLRVLAEEHDGVSARGEALALVGFGRSAASTPALWLGAGSQKTPPR